ncbi:MAG: branched-chain amino acid transporter permease [Bacillota bacterium]|jgi:branched-subunit amino acid transport protein AzlD
MYLTPVQTLIIIAAISLGTIVTRFMPFLLFPEGRETPKVITYLGDVLPPAMMGLLIVYCLKGVSLIESPHGLPELIAIIVIVILHLWRRNVLLSLAVGTALYMFLIQAVFV